MNVEGHTLPASAIRGLELTDAMPRGLRQCVHEFGFPIVDAFVTAGVTEPRHIRHLVTVCWQGARSSGDRSTKITNQLDAILLQSGSDLSSAGLLRILRQSGLSILQLDPTDCMVDASIEETANLGLVSKREKHKARLRAAMRAGAARMWPGLFGTILAALVYSTAAWAQPAEVPDPTITPGAIASTDINDICSRKGGSYSQRHRLSQTESVKRKVLQNYGVPWADRAKYEDDHLYSLCGGGSDSILNRWAQPRFGKWTAADKDKIEAHGCHELCVTHSITQPQFMLLLAPDWRRGFCAIYPTDPRCADLEASR